MVRFVKGQMICQLTNKLSFCQFPRPDLVKHIGEATVSSKPSSKRQAIAHSDQLYLAHGHKGSI